MQHLHKVAKWAGRNGSAPGGLLATSSTVIPTLLLFFSSLFTPNFASAGAPLKCDIRHARPSPYLSTNQMLRLSLAEEIAECDRIWLIFKVSIHTCVC